MAYLERIFRGDDCDDVSEAVRGPGAEDLVSATVGVSRPNWLYHSLGR